MNRPKKHFKSIIFTTLIFAFFFAFWFLLFTEIGTNYLTKKLLTHFLQKRTIHWQKNEGTLINGVTYESIRIDNLKWFPQPNQLTIQSFSLDITGLRIDKISMNIREGKLVLPDADPILFWGTFENQQLDINVFTPSLTDIEITSLFPENSLLRKISGILKNVDIYVKGKLNEPQLTGELLMKNIAYNGFTLNQAPSSFDIQIKDSPDGFGLQGPFTVKSGILKGEKTALVQLFESIFFFKGNPQTPDFNIKAKSIVEKIKMDISIQGNFQKPELQISSEPPLPKERLLLALATNKTWKNTENVLQSGAISADIAKDFIDYFLFGGQSNQLTQKLGIKSFSIKNESNTKGVAVSKDLSDTLEGKYAIEKTTTDQTSSTTQKIGGELKVTDSITLEANKKITTENTNTTDTPKESTDNQFLLKYKKSF